MGRGAAVVIAVVAVLVGGLLALQLWRRRRGGDHPWTTAEYLTALGMVVALLAIVLPIVLTESGPSPEETAYRQKVKAACASLQPTTNPLLTAMQAGGSISRDVLLRGFRDQVRGSEAVLADLWAHTSPDNLAEQVARAREASDTLVTATNRELDRMASELPAKLSFQSAMSELATVDAATRPAAARLKSALSQLAGETCEAPTAQPSR